MQADTATSEYAKSLATLDAKGAEQLALPDWNAAEWQAFLDCAEVREAKAGVTVISRGTQERTLYVILRGELEVMAHSSDGVSFGRIARLGAGAVVGEQAFFDGAPRSAGAWSVGDSVLAAITPEQFAAFAKENPGPGYDFLFALGRILSLRLERTTAQAFG
jgi:CRP/FNR family cyclic AMP-dependent transcriptional regulator